MKEYLTTAQIAKYCNLCIPTVRKIILKGEIKEISVGELAEKVASHYRVNTGDLLVSCSEHKEARKVLIELAYRLCLQTNTLNELGKQLGGISGSGIVRVHKRFDGNLSETIDQLTQILSIV